MRFLKFKKKKTIKLHLQAESAECGLACIAMVLSHYGYQTDLPSLRGRFPITSRGVNLKQLITISSKLDTIARPLRLELEDLHKLRKPCILHWNLNHFVVLKKISGNKAVILDPARGEMKLTLEKVSGHFTGIALELYPDEGFKEGSEKRKTTFRELPGKETQIKSPIFKILTLSFLIQIFILISPFFSQILIDDIIAYHNYRMLNIITLFFMVILLFNVSLTLYRGLMTIRFSNVISVNISTRLFRHLMALPISFFYKRNLGDIISRFESLKIIKNFITNGFIEVIVDGVLTIAILGFMFSYSIQLSCIVLGIAMLYTVIRFILYGIYRKTSEINLNAIAIENSHFIESIRTIQSIKLAGNSGLRESQWLNKLIDSINCGIKLSQITLCSVIVNQLIFGLEAIVILYISALQIIDETITIGMMFAFVAYKTMFTNRYREFIEKLMELRLLYLHLERVSDVTLTEKENLLPDSRYGSVVQAETKMDIELKGIDYAFSTIETPLFTNVNLTIKEGVITAIVGPSGCGKSTLLKIMMGLLMADSGKVLVGGVDIRAYGIEKYREQISAVLQSDELFSGSIGDNISGFSATKDYELVEQCAKLASIHHDIMKMPMGYDTIVGDVGSHLSGGQKQRVFLARALYKQPKILFLDEATCQLDYANEDVVLKSLLQLNITIVIISHRKETTQIADEVIDMNRLLPHPMI
ncbi:peptidase domain-containing ABC transporter [Serratia quinivorans]|uniref:peptidase domain-containing ABC transporter n=1 Tax=Serratia quinivorans TaxID=137545 RepID=UPI00217C5B30|nr:peptidase domain-containing ABC transporter [Serratia quinivorans]CAI0943445.1 RTX-I toxin determinant B [Serratia quinivorans]CAI1739786.1 RTX-I toxin determinant B [Serratia quinivorans]